MEHDTLLYLIWWLDRRLLLPLTHRQKHAERHFLAPHSRRRAGKRPTTWAPRRFTPMWLAAHPWLWCRECSDGLTTWAEVRRGVCEVCNADHWLDQALEEAAAAGDTGLFDAHRFTVIRRVSIHIPIHGGNTQ